MDGWSYHFKIWTDISFIWRKIWRLHSHRLRAQKPSAWRSGNGIMETLLDTSSQYDPFFISCRSLFHASIYTQIDHLPNLKGRNAKYLGCFKDSQTERVFPIQTSLWEYIPYSWCFAHAIHYVRASLIFNIPVLWFSFLFFVFVIECHTLCSAESSPWESGRVLGGNKPSI